MEGLATGLFFLSTSVIIPMRLLKSLSVFILILYGPVAWGQQLLLGKNPYAMNKSAVLELNSDNQGLLLPRIADTTLINALTPPDGMMIYFVPTKQILWRSNGYWKAPAQNNNYITALTGDVTAAGPGAAAATVTGLQGASLPSLSTGFLKFDGTSWFFDNSSYVTAIAAGSLQTVTTAGNTSSKGIILTENGNSSANSYALRLRRANDSNPQGYLIQGQNNGGTADVFSVDASGNVAVVGNTGIGTSSPNASLDVNGDVAMRMGSFIAPVLINNNIAVGKYASIRVSGPVLAYSITGIAGGYDGRMLILYNSTGVDMVLTHNDILSTASNRIYCADNTSITVKKNGCATLMYSATDSRWIVVSTTK